MRPMRFLPAALAAVTLLLPAVAPAGTSSPDLDGPFLFVDKKGFEHITSLANIDQAFGEFCISGQVVYVDSTNTLNRRVAVLYHALGSISKSSESKVVGDFSGVAVDIQVITYSGPALPPLDNSQVLTDSGTITPPCSLRAQVKKSGEMDSVGLACDLGPNLASLNIPASVPNPYPQDQPDISQQSIVDSIGFALGAKNTVKLDTKTGAFKLSHRGVPEPDGFDSPLVCPTSSDAPPLEE